MNTRSPSWSKEIVSNIQNSIRGYIGANTSVNEFSQEKWDDICQDAWESICRYHNRYFNQNPSATEEMFRANLNISNHAGPALRKTIRLRNRSSKSARFNEANLKTGLHDSILDKLTAIYELPDAIQKLEEKHGVKASAAIYSQAESKNYIIPDVTDECIAEARARKEKNMKPATDQAQRRTARRQLLDIMSLAVMLAALFMVGNNHDSDEYESKSGQSFSTTEDQYAGHRNGSSDRDEPTQYAGHRNGSSDREYSEFKLAGHRNGSTSYYG